MRVNVNCGNVHRTTLMSVKTHQTGIKREWRERNTEKKRGEKKK